MLLSAAALAGAFTAACGALPRPAESPQVDVRAVGITSVTAADATGYVDLSIANPNGFGVPLRHGTWTLSLGGARAVAGTFDLDATIPPRGTAAVRAALHVDLAGAATVARQLAGGNRLYALRGTLTFATPVGPIDVAFDHRGELADAPRPGLPLQLGAAPR
ncbi:MAG: hypothetical protein D6689_12565 [Deltaproteobacteria bacterium]|nr:MAG: hypothetical protein D6689_12565 [Deltaproteobacteria bacterium]